MDDYLLKLGKSAESCRPLGMFMFGEGESLLCYDGTFLVWDLKVERIETVYRVWGVR